VSVEGLKSRSDSGRSWIPEFQPWNGRGQDAHRYTTHAYEHEAQSNGGRYGRGEQNSFDTPDEIRTPDNTTVDVPWLGGETVARVTLQPGWKCRSA
jgi:hypothetical protein